MNQTKSLKCSYCGKEIRLDNNDMIGTEILFDELLCKVCAIDNYLKRG